jgi:putative flavoprotein involved in K+ transport
MSVEHIETLIIGAGQAGLATARQLQLSGHDCLVVDANERVGDGWRRQWDTLKLYSPAKYDGLPGMPFPGRAWSFPGKDEVGDYFESYAKHFDLPVRLDTRVDRLAAHGDGYVASCGDVTILADNVVVATGTFGRTPSIPDFADELDPMIMQLHSSEYRRPAQLREGPVLVVGASHSGMDIAYELAADRTTILSGRDPGQIPARLGSPLFKLVFPIVLFVFTHVLSRSTPIGRKQMEEFRFHGGPALRVKRSDLRDRGVERLPERVIGVKNGLPLLDGGRVADVTNVVWCTGFRQAFDWIDVPIFGDDGWPKEMRGVVETSPGLYFCGLGFQYAAASMLIVGAARDAGFVAEHIAKRMSAPASPAVNSVSTV